MSTEPERNGTRQCELKLLSKMCYILNFENFFQMLAKAYPDYLRQLQEAAVNPSLPMPTLNGMPYRMDRYSFVTGFDMSLDVHLDVMLPKYPTDVFVCNLQLYVTL